jgi:hypothetical protein
MPTAFYWYVHNHRIGFADGDPNSSIGYARNLDEARELASNYCRGAGREFGGVTERRLWPDDE